MVVPTKSRQRLLHKDCILFPTAFSPAEPNNQISQPWLIIWFTFTQYSSGQRLAEPKAAPGHKAKTGRFSSNVIENLSSVFCTSSGLTLNAGHQRWGIVSRLLLVLLETLKPHIDSSYLLKQLLSIDEISFNNPKRDSPTQPVRLGIFAQNGIRADFKNSVRQSLDHSDAP